MTRQRRYSWWLCLLLAVLAAGPACAQSDRSRDQRMMAETRQLLDWLGVLPLLEQAPTVLAQALSAEAEFRGAGPAEVQSWRRRLAPSLIPVRLQEKVIRHVAANCQEAVCRRALELLQQPLPKRVRYFELAMSQPGTAAELRAFLAEPGAPAARRALIRQLLDIAGTDLLVAQLQTEISERVRRAAGAPESTAAQLADELAERRRYLAEPTENYLLYAYRFLRDDELTEFRRLLEDRDLRWLSEISQQAVIAALRDAD